METWKHGDIDLRHRNMEKWRQGDIGDIDMETRRHGHGDRDGYMNMETWT